MLLNRALFDGLAKIFLAVKTIPACMVPRVIEEDGERRERVLGFDRKGKGLLLHLLHESIHFNLKV